jgi:hypothetical protein
VGALVTLDLPDDSPVLALPWIITFQPMSDDEEWEPGRGRGAGPLYSRSWTIHTVWRPKSSKIQER